MAQNFTVPVGLYTSATNPTVPTPATGDIYYNTSSSEMRVYNGSTWVAVGGGGAAAAGTLTGTTLASNVINSSLTSFGSSPTIDTPALTLSATTSNSTGRIAWDNTNSQIEIGNGSSLKIFTADDAAATLTNKTISGANNTVSTTGTLTIGTGLSGTSFNGSSNVTIAIDSTVATLTGTQTLTNKTLTTTGTITANAGGGWSGSNFGKQLLITTPSNQSNPAIALTDAVGGNLWGIANASGTFYLATGPAYSDSTTAPTVRFAISSTGQIGMGTTSFAAAPYIATTLGALYINQQTDITPGANGEGQLKIGGNGYSGFLALDGSTMWVGHNSNGRSLTLATDETARLTISGTGAVNIPGATTLSNLTLTGTVTAGGGAGTNGQFLQSTGTGVTWAAVSAAAATRSALGTVFGFTSNADIATTGGQTWLGFQSGSSSANGARGSTAIGYQAGNAWSTGELNHVYVGWRAGFADSGGVRNTVIGAAAMAIGTNNDDIVAVGYYAGYRAGLTGPGSTNSVFVGSSAAELVYGTSRFTDATIIGYRAARQWASGQWYFGNTIIGSRACLGNGGGTTTASQTTVIGADAWVNPDAGTTGNTVVGAFAMGASNNNKATSFSTAVGYLAGWDSTTNGQTSIGYAAGYTVSGTENTFLGYRSGINLVTGSNNTVIGARANVSSFSVSNQITLGNSSITQLRCQVTTISGLSDARDKTNIIDIPIGLDFINAIRPVVFEWNHRPEYDDEGNEIPNAKRGTREGSFIAQELDAAQQKFDVEDWLAIVAKDNPDKLEAAPAKLIPVLVKAVQELSAKIEELEQRLGG